MDWGVVMDWDMMNCNWLHVFNNWNMFHNRNYVMVSAVFMLVRSGNWNLVYYWSHMHNWNMFDMMMSVPVMVSTVDSSRGNCQKSSQNCKYGIHDE